MDTQNNINNIIDIMYLTPENSEFSVSENGFLQLKATVKNPEIKTKEGEPENNKTEEIFFERVLLHRAFPFDNPFKFISAVGCFPKPPEEKKDDEKENKEPKEKKEDSPAPPRENTTSLGDLKEIGIVSDIEVFEKKQKQYLLNELNRKYFTPVIEIIYSLKDKYGFSYWEVKTDAGKLKFTVNDAFRNIIKITDDRIIINDVNGNRYEVKSLENFDKASYRKIELYL